MIGILGGPGGRGNLVFRRFRNNNPRMQTLAASDILKSPSWEYMVFTGEYVCGTWERRNDLQDWRRQIGNEQAQVGLLGVIIQKKNTN